MSLIIAAHDISGVGRCSLTTALAVLPAMGHTCYPVPTAVLSQQTGLQGYSYLDLTDSLPDYINGLKRLDISPDMIYTGFLGRGPQAGLLAGFIREYPGARIVVDPVMGDNGRLYACFDGEYVKSMAPLVREANILVPNATEFNLLSGRDPGEKLPRDKGGLLSAARRIDAPALKYIVITSAVTGAGACNMVIDAESGGVFEIPYRDNGVSYNGAGDLFASVMCGRLANGHDIKDAVPFAAKFVADCIDNMPQNSNTKFGVAYEQKLSRLLDGNDI